MNIKSTMKQALMLVAGLLAIASSQAQAQAAPTSTAGGTASNSPVGNTNSTSQGRSSVPTPISNQPPVSNGNSSSQGVTIITIQTPNTTTGKGADKH